MGPATVCLVWNGFLVLWYWNALRPPRERIAWLGVIICLPHAAIGLFLIYATLAGFLNRTVIKVTSELLTVWQGPVPYWGSHRSVPIDELERLDCDKAIDPETDKEKHGPYVYGVYALTKEGNKVDLVTGLDRAEALFVQQELERWLKIGAHGPGREGRS